MWYAIQTTTGKEQELIDVINLRADHDTYSKCFSVRREAVWRRKGRYILHIETLFPGYIFVETEDPGAFYQELKKIPRFSRLLGKELSEKWTRQRQKEMLSKKNTPKQEKEQNPDASEKPPAGAQKEPKRKNTEEQEILFHSVSPEEEEFLKRLIGDDPENIVRLSPVELDENSEIVKCGGALSYYRDSIIKKRIRLRYVVIRIPFFGRNRDILLGIRVEKEKILNMLDMD